jgi:hypothetical protein
MLPAVVASKALLHLCMGRSKFAQVPQDEPQGPMRFGVSDRIG